MNIVYKIKEYKELGILFELNNNNQLDIHAPKGVLTETIISDIKIHKEAILAFYLNISNTASSISIDYKPIEAVAKQDFYDLSNAQRRLWIMDQFGENSITYNMPVSFILEGELRVGAFNQAYSFMLERHESLRTVFVTKDGNPRQIVLEKPEFCIEVIDLRDSDDREGNARALVEKDLLTSFNLETGPLVRFTIVRIEDKKNLFIFNMHHIISDGWSMNIYIREFLICYNSYSKGNIPDLNPLRIQYKDYSAWQCNLLESDDINNQKEYWLDKLSGELPVLDLPSDNIRPVPQTFNGNSIEISINRNTKSALYDLCRQNEVSLFMMLQALIKTLLFRYTGQDDIILGSPVAGRVHEDLDNQIGFYVNTLIFRNTISSESRFTDLLKSIKKTSTEAFDNQDYPFERIIEDLDIKKDLSRSPLFDVMLVLQNTDITDIEFDSLHLYPYKIENKISKFDMTFSFSERDECIYCGIQYNTDIYSDDRIWRMGEHLGTLISSVLGNPETKVKDLDIIPDGEKNLLLNVFNDTSVDCPFDKTIIELFEDQVEKTPDNVALVYEDVELTYGELNEKSNIVAHYLMANYNIKPDDLVGVLLQRSEKLVIAILGILKSGGAYVPIDHEYPKDRIDFILEDSSPKVVLSETEKDLLVDLDVILGSDLSMGNPDKMITCDNLAYVIYTSGSTGRPKGTLIEHKSLINLSHWHIGEFDLSDNDIVSQYASISFDASVWEIFPSLICGSVLHILGEKIRLDIEKLSLYLDGKQITVAFLPTPVYEVFKNRQNNKLRIVLTGGAKLKSYINNNYKLFNNYGPTENTVVTTSSPVNNQSTNIPIGKPILNTHIFILDKERRLVPVGVSGELCICGLGLARGYLNRPELTGEKFIDNPFFPGERMYRTGDLARWLPDGNIEFLGRIDSQVKIRGFRIELGEIENILQKHMEISTSLVVSKENNNGDTLLVAYYVSGDELEFSDLRVYLGRSLPDYMIPSCFIHMKEFPLTSNGKIDRRALPELDGNMDTGVEYMAPRNDIDEALVYIWQEILGIERVGIQDNFFELGGHSLKATRIVSRICKDLEVNVTLRDIFSNPTIETLSKIIFQSNKTEYKQIEEIPEQISYDISNAQKRLWILDQFEKESIAYNMPSAFILEGELRTEAFNQAYSFILERHESLRTVFIIEDGEPRQKILENPGFEIEIIDLRGGTDREENARALVDKDLLTPFNLETGPLVRLTIIQMGDERNLLLFNMHHIISDGWSMNIFIREFLTCYNSYSEGNSPDLNPLRIQYKDYSAWQNYLLESDDINNQKEYWLDKLSGDLPVLDLPSDNIRPVSQTFNGNSIGFSLAAEISSALNDLCRENNVSLFMMLQTLVKVLFHRYTGQSDIIVGSPVAGRIHEDLANQIGFYVNTLVFRDTINSNCVFNDVLDSVRKTCTEAFDNQIYPFDRLVEDLGLKRDLSRSPLFDVMLTVNNNEGGNAGLDGIKISPYGIKNLISKFDMSFDITEGEEGLHVSITYNTDIYAEERIMGMSAHLKKLIHSVIYNPEICIKDLEIIPKEERILLLNVFNDTKTDFPADKTIVNLFEEQVERAPESIAVVFQGVELTYRELNGKANIIAHYLRDKYNIKPYDLVGVMLERSEKMIIALLGILKSGAAYVPIDPEYPQERIDFILEDSNTGIVLGESNSGLLIDINPIINTGKNSNNPVGKSNPTSPAYLIYTSGSTGRSKGVLLEHGSVVNLILSQKSSYCFDSNECILQFSNICFDASVEQIWLALLTGSSLVLISKESLLSHEEFNNYICENKITHLDTVPSFLCDIELTQSNQLKRIILGGEDFPIDIARKYYGEIELFNCYGPTETTVTSICHKLDSLSDEQRLIPIGKPISNTRVYILDEEGNLRPMGVPGELCISGSGLGKGYLNRPELTVEKFVDNPFISGDRMYRTGDLARWNPDGNIEFLGRIDNQVKVRGFRIELGEIENSLAKYCGINSVVVQVKEGTGGDKQLIAYYTSVNELEISDIRNFLGKSLPHYMIPSYFIHMEEFPLTSNGKIDRRALPELDGNMDTGVEYVAPGDDIEEILVNIWQEILGLERIGIRDNFFELGGHSLKATKVVSRISKDLEVNVSLRDIFSNPTIETLSKIIFQSNKTEYTQIKEVPEQNSYDISNAQKRLWILDQFEEESIAYNMPSAFILEGELRTEAFNEAYTFMLERHESLRTVFIIENGEPRQMILENPGFEIEIVDLRGGAGQEENARALVENDLHTSFNLETGPLIRFAIVQMENERNLLLFNMHHIISDGWSMNIFIKEFITSYNCFMNERPPELKPLRIHYKDYSAWQNNLLESNEIFSQKQYWLDKLSGELPVLDLPSDNVRPVLQTFNGNSIDLSITKETMSALDDLCRQNEVSLFMMLQTLVKVLFYRYTGQTDIIIGSPLAGRSHEDLDDQIGFYVNTLPFRDSIAGDSSFTKILKSVCKSCTEAFDNQDFPFDRLIEELDIKRDLSRSSLFDVMLVLQNYDSAKVEFDGLELLSYKRRNVVSKFDITFNFSEYNESLYCNIQYNTDIYVEKRIRRMGEHFKILVSSVIENPRAKIKDLEIIGDEERNLLLNVFNNTKVNYSTDTTIIDLFEEQVEKTPDNIAVVFEDVELSYRELNRRTNIVAHYLCDDYGIESEDLIGVLLPRSEKMIITLLGILKTGAAYIPIDPDYPQERIDYILEDSNPRIVIGDKTAIYNSNTRIIRIDDLLQTCGNIENPEQRYEPENLAYIIYTSGSTGKPKGTLIEHRGLFNYLSWMKKSYGESTGNWSHITSYSFDLCVTALYSPLITGNRLLIYNSSLDVSEMLAKSFSDPDVNSVKLTPSHILILENLDIDSTGIRYVFVGGEELKAESIGILREINSQIRIINHYGPTESTVGCITNSIEPCNVSLSIGKPVSNTQIHILDKDLSLLPIDIPGELCVSGSGLARGYLNMPELTDMKFIDNPFLTGERMYRTGDSAKWLDDGNIEFLGRIDNQIKIRGFRIEPGEIEKSLLRHDKISSVVVMVKEGFDRDRQLVAYLISCEELEISQIRSYLKLSLPDYMIPSFFVQMDSFPLTANGKIDRKGLPELDRAFSSGVKYIAPRNETEKKLIEIWRDVLDVENIGISDNFFELGGHSLKATRLVTRISKDMEVNVSLRDIFSKPTIGDLSEIINQSNKIHYKQIEAVQEKDSYDISSAQRRLWVLDQFDKESTAYNMPVAFVLDGKLKLDAFNQAYSFMLDRHESLRTIFVIKNGVPKQKILDKPGYNIEIVDLRNSNKNELQAGLLAETDILTPFNLETGPLIRFTIVKIEDEKNQLLFNMHHIISDGWSMNIFIREFLVCYNSFREGNYPDLEPLRIHYKDYAAWQNNLFNSSFINDQKKYWLDKLSGELPVLDLPSDKIRPVSQTFNGKSISFTLVKETFYALNYFCKESNVSLFMMLQALLKVLFHRYTGQTDIILGSPIAGRVHEDLEDQIGFYVNTLPLRDTIDSDLSFKDILGFVRNTCTEAFDNQDYPFDRLVEDLDIKRDLSRSPLFDVMLVLQNNERTAVDFDGLEFSPYNNKNHISKFDMTYSFAEREGYLYCGIEYNTDIYSEDRIKRMIEHLKTLISSVVENPETMIKNLQIIPPKEKNRILNVFNDTKIDFPSSKTIVDLFEEQVERTPDNVAVVFGDNEMTFRELNGKANIVANYLRYNYDIKPDDLVGVLLERSEKMIIAIIGILKSGAAYVPIDLEYPASRIEYILQDTKLKIILSNKMDGIFIEIDKILKNTDMNLTFPRNNNSNNLAYIIYTSGSTGNPKGIAIENRSVINFLTGLNEFVYRNYTRHLNIALFASFSFDGSIQQIFSSLTLGNTLFIVPEEYKRNIDKLLNFYVDNSIDITDATPVVIDMLNINVSEYAKMLQLKELIIAGDVLMSTSIKRFLSNFNTDSAPKITNAYGPTECCVDSSYYRVEVSDLCDSKILPIGKPAINVGYYIFDENLELSPLGCFGELHISGEGLARGYFNNKALTDEKYIVNPVTNERMYKTGDIVRWNPDGNIDFLGRKDNQVKIRNFRIELGEIENSLIDHTDISSVAVIVLEDDNGEKDLAAYYVSEKEMKISDIRSFLKDTLPNYMIPSYFIQMESLPLTQNRKIDRKALPKPDGRINTGIEYVPPRNNIEEKLVEIWQEFLGVERIGIYDDFFELGGHSLKASRSIVEINNYYNIHILLRDFFETPTINDISIRIEILLANNLDKNRKKMKKITL